VEEARTSTAGEEEWEEVVVWAPEGTVFVRTAGRGYPMSEELLVLRYNVLSAGQP